MAKIFTGEASSGSGMINDTEVSLAKTYSSNKIEALLTPKANKSNGAENDILVRDANGNPKSSGKKISDFSDSGHNHNADDVILSTTNFGNVLNGNVDTLQELADFIDDNIGFGRSLEFNWNGTQLGIRQEGETNYQYVQLKGDTGKGLEFNWNGTELGIRVEGDTNYQYVNLKGDTGKNIEFNWNGTELGIRQEGDTDYTYTNLKGDTGRSIVGDPVRTSGDGSPGTTDTYTITYSDNTTSTFSITHGVNGEGAMQSVTADNGSLIQIDNTDPANPVFSLQTLIEANISDLDKYTVSEVDAIANTKLSLSNIVDNLISIDTDKALSAKQGKVLKDAIDNINSVLSSDDTTLDELQEVVNFIKQNKSTLDTLGISNIAGLQSALDGKANNSDITNLQGIVNTKADDSNVVHKTGDEVIGGKKEINPVINNNDLIINTKLDGSKNDPSRTSGRALVAMPDHLRINYGEDFGYTSIHKPRSESSQESNGNALTRKDYVDSQVSSAGGFPKAIYTGNIGTSTSGYYTVTHNLGVSQSDVQNGRYMVILTGKNSNNRGVSAGLTGYAGSSTKLYGHEWGTGNGSQYILQWQSNTVKFQSPTAITGKFIILQLY